MNIFREKHQVLQFMQEKEVKDNRGNIVIIYEPIFPFAFSFNDLYKNDGIKLNLNYSNQQEIEDNSNVQENNKELFLVRSGAGALEKLAVSKKWEINNEYKFIHLKDGLTNIVPEENNKGKIIEVKTENLSESEVQNYFIELNDYVETQIRLIK